MRTPAGVECSYFYGDYYRGRNQEECRLIGRAAPPYDWRPDLCQTCPVPAIQRANDCQNMVLQATVSRGFLGRWRRVRIKAYCTLSKKNVQEPEIGCGQCHPMLPIFTEKLK